MTNRNQEAPRTHQDGSGATGRPLAGNAIHRPGKTLTNDAAGAPKKRGRRPAEYEMKPDPDPSPAKCDPYVRLAAAALIQSVIDLEDESLLKSMDSLCFLASDLPKIFLECLDFPLAPELLLIGGGIRREYYRPKRGKDKPGQLTCVSDPGHGPN